ALNARLDGHGVAREGAPPSDLSLEVVATEKEIAAALQANRGGQPLVSLDARAGVPIAALIAADPAVMERAPLSIEGTINPLSLAEWLPPRTDEEDRK